MVPIPKETRDKNPITTTTSIDWSSITAVSVMTNNISAHPQHPQVHSAHFLLLEERSLHRPIMGLTKWLNYENLRLIQCSFDISQNTVRAEPSIFGECQHRSRQGHHQLHSVQPFQTSIDLMEFWLEFNQGRFLGHWIREILDFSIFWERMTEFAIFRERVIHHLGSFTSSTHTTHTRKQVVDYRHTTNPSIDRQKSQRCDIFDFSNAKR